MITVAYLFVGILFYVYNGTLPTDPLLAVQTSHRQPTRWEILAAASLCCLAVAIWPLAVAWRAVAHTRRLTNVRTTTSGRSSRFDRSQAPAQGFVWKPSTRELR